MHRWANCSSALAFGQHYPKTGSIFAAEGTLGHHIAAECLTTGSEPLRYSGHTYFVSEAGEVTRSIDRAEQFGRGWTFTFDAEYADAVQTYVDAIKRLPGEKMIEERIDVSQVYGQPEQFGTGDVITLDYGAEQISVDDAKFGRGEAVFADDNEQLLSYGAGALLQYECVADWKTVRVAIHQPRLHSGPHYDERIYTVAEVRAFIERATDAAATASLLLDADNDMLNAMAHPGPKQCRWCPHANNCVSRANYVHEAVFDDFADVAAGPPFEVLGGAPVANTVKRDPAGFEPGVLASMLERLEVISAFASELQAEALKRLQGGLPVPGWKIVRGRRGARRWKDEAAAETALKKAKLKSDEMYNKKLITAPQAEKVLKDKPRVWGKLQDNIGQSDGPLHLAPESDSRPAVTTDAAFDDVSEMTQ